MCTNDEKGRVGFIGGIHSLAEPYYVAATGPRKWVLKGIAPKGYCPVAHCVRFGAPALECRVNLHATARSTRFDFRFQSELIGLSQ